MSTILALAIVFIVGAVANLMTAVVDFFLDGIWDIFEMSNTAFLNLFGSTASDYYSQYFLPFSLALACILCGVALVRCLLPEEVRGRADSLGGLLYRLPMVLFFVILSTFFMSQISSGFQYLFDEIKNTVNIDLSATEALVALEDKGLTSSQTYPADYSFINDILNQLLATIFTAWLYFNVLRIMQSVAVKYVLQHLLLLLSPLAFSTLATSNTQSICFSYLKLYIGTLVALLIDVFLSTLYMIGINVFMNSPLTTSSGTGGLLVYFFILLGLAKIITSIDAYIDKVGLNGVSVPATAPGLGSVVMTTALAVRNASHLLPKNSSGSVGTRTENSARNAGMGESINGEATDGRKTDSAGHVSSAGTASAKQASGTNGSAPAGKAGMANMGPLAGLKEGEKLTGNAAQQAFSDMMQHGKSGIYTGAISGEDGITPLAMRKNYDTGQWEGAPLSDTGDPTSYNAADFRPMDDLVKESGANMVSMTNGQNSGQWGLHPGQNFSVSGAASKMDQILNMTEEPGRASLGGEETAFAESGAFSGSNAPVSDAALASPLQRGSAGVTVSETDGSMAGASAGGSAFSGVGSPSSGDASATMQTDGEGAAVTEVNKGRAGASPVNTGGGPTIRSNVMGSDAHFKAVSVTGNQVRGYYANSPGDQVGAFVAFKVSPKDYADNPANTIRLADGSYMRFKQAEPQSRTARAASHMAFNGTDFVSKSVYHLDDNGQILHG